MEVQSVIVICLENKEFTFKAEEGRVIELELDEGAYWIKITEADGSRSTLSFPLATTIVVETEELPDE